MSATIKLAVNFNVNTSFVIAAVGFDLGPARVAALVSGNHSRHLQTVGCHCVPLIYSSSSILASHLSHHLSSHPGLHSNFNTVFQNFT